MPEDKNNLYIEKIKHLLSQISIQTYLYALLVIGAIVLIISNTNLGKRDYLVNKNSSQECRDVRGQTIKIDPSKGEGCIDIFGAARDYGIDLSYTDTNNSNNDYANDSSNLTFDMSKDLILTNIYLEQNGVTGSTEKGKIFNNIIQDYKNSYIKDKYSISDLQLTRNKDKDSISAYRQEIYIIILSYLSQTKQINPNEINLDSTISFNTKIIDTLLTTSATDEGAIYQLKFINLLNSANVYFNSINKIAVDPVKYLASGGDTYMYNFKTQLESIINDFDNYFKK